MSAIFVGKLPTLRFGEICLHWITYIWKVWIVNIMCNNSRQKLTVNKKCVKVKHLWIINTSVWNVYRLPQNATPLTQWEFFILYLQVNFSRISLNTTILNNEWFINNNFFSLLDVRIRFLREFYSRTFFLPFATCCLSENLACVFCQFNHLYAS